MVADSPTTTSMSTSPDAAGRDRGPSAIPDRRRSFPGSASSGRDGSSARSASLLVLAGVAWWMLRSPAVPTESRLPLAQRAEAAAAWRQQRAARDAADDCPTPTTSVAVVVVHVTGAVRAPGVYELRPGQRVADAIDAAGGALADADADALNLAAPVADGDRIAVPTVGESSALGGAAGPRPRRHRRRGGRASGRSTSTRPVSPSWRRCPGSVRRPPRRSSTTATQHGPFATIDDLEAVRGIGPAKIEAIRDHVTV